MTSILIVAVPFLLVFALAIWCRRYVCSVADFLVAGRCAGRYVLVSLLTCRKPFDMDRMRHRGKCGAGEWGDYFFVVSVIVPAAVGLVTVVWFGIGIVRDLRRLFRDLEPASPTISTMVLSPRTRGC